MPAHGLYLSVSTKYKQFMPYETQVDGPAKLRIRRTAPIVREGVDVVVSFEAVLVLLGLTFSPTGVSDRNVL